MKILTYLSIFVVLLSCQQQSRYQNDAYFYPLEKSEYFYVYRDVKNGLEEQIHRIYKVEDSYGEHLVVEVYTGEGRIIEAYNYLTDSLQLIDHMVVNAQGKKQKADLIKNTYFPLASEETYFATRFPGFYDSTFILREVKRTKQKEWKEMKLDLLDQEVPVIQFKDKIRQSLFNPFEHKENVVEGIAFSYYAKGMGLVEWHDKNKKIHYKLEQVLDAKEGAELLR